MSNVEIVAEVGSNWYTDNRSRARGNVVRSIAEAASAGATIVKFQIFTADTLYSKERAPAAWENIKKYEFPIDVLPDAHAMAIHVGVKLWATVFSPSLLDAIPLTYLDGIKVASGDLTYTELLKAMAKKSALHKIPLAISIGAANAQEIREAITTARLFDVHSLVMFYCVSSYPAPLESMNLASGMIFRDQVDAVGFSDHTLGCGAAVVATCLGYTYFEKHFAGWDSEVTPDTSVSMNPDRFREYSNTIVGTQVIIGTSEKLIYRGEMSERINARRGPDGLRPAIA